MKCKATYPNLTQFAHLFALIAVGVFLVAAPQLMAGVEEFARPDDESASRLVAEEVSWLPGEERVPGVFPNAPPSELGAAKLHYIDAAGDPRASVLVYMKPTTAKRGVERNEVRAIAAQSGGHVHYEYEVALPGVMNLRDIPTSEIENIRKMPGVERVEIDEYHPNVVRLHDSIPLIRGLDSQITGAGFTADGAGVRICVVDTGIDSDHLMYSTRIDAAAGFDFHNNDPNPEDDNGHGSHVSGIALGGLGLSWDPCGTGSIPIQGVAPAATLIGAKVLNSGGGGFTSNIVAGIDHCADQSPLGGRADIINMSIGTGNFAGTCTHAWAVAANNAVANGVVAVAASGNENNSNSMGSPACGVDVIAVGMTWKNDYPTCEDPITNWNWGICTDFSPQTDEVGCFSNESDFLDVTAPGANIWSASIAAGGGSIVGQSGTSMSSPHVAGLAALILDMDPSLTPAEVRQIIRDGAIDMGPAGFDRAYGWGRIDVLDTLTLVGGGCTNPIECDDGLFCNGAEDCVAGSCVSGTPPNCDDGVGCTDDSCNEGTDSCDNVANDANCDNGLFCDGAETCHATLDCQSGTPPNCDDGVGCTDDSCNEGTDSCDNVANNANCDDGLFCNGAETCNATLDCQAGSDPCPGQVCLESTDECVDCTGNPDCDDGLFCNGAETCVGGACQAGTPPNCDDGVGCTDDSCNEGTDTCDNVADNANCDDGLFCNGAETCSATLDCQSGTPPNCDDGVGCTDDSCNEGTDSCDNIANDANCPDDGLFCNGTEFCDPILDCSSTGDPCGGAGCDEGTDTCAGPAARLEAGSVTVGATPVTVNLTNTYVSPVIVCTAQYDNNAIPIVTRVTGVTPTSFDVYLQNPGDLSTPVADNVSFLVVEEGTWNIDGVNVEAQTYLSTVTDENNSWVGQAQSYGQSYTNPVVVGQVMSVNDTDWSVFWCRGSAQGNPPSATTLFTGKHVAEDPVVPRNDETVGFIVFESGHGTIGGVAFEAVLGTDTILGVDDAPPYAYTFNTAFATAPDVGIANIGGMDGGNGGWGQIHGPTLATTTTLNLSIDEDQINDPERNRTTDQIEYVVFESAVVFPAGPVCTIPADCDDGLFCNGAEDCVTGSCVAGTPPNCDDGVGCTDDSCNEGTDSCDNIANDANCDNGLFCDGAETCDPVLDCQGGTPPNCDDGVGCTDDSCNEGTDSCDNVANDANCDDGLFCNGAETCHATLDCQAGTAPNCDDGVGCTDDSCNEGTDSCDNIANDANCPDDGLFCNGTEFCDAVADCSSTGDPCSGGEVCNEATDTCDPIGGGAQLETGTVTVGSGGTTVNLVNTYASPVVVCTVNYNNNTIPVVTRVSGVTPTSFDVRLQNAGAGSVAAETVHYIVVEEGTWTIDGVNIEAQTYTSTVTDENNSWVGEAQSYGQGYTTPVVLGQVMSEFDLDWSVFWNQGTARNSPPSASTLRTGKTVCEDTLTTRADETIGFIVIEAGSGTINGVAYEAALGADTVRGVTNAPPYTYTFGSAFGSTPQVGIVTMAAVDGVNGGWAYLFGASPLSATAMDLVVDEDTIGDTERNHTTEQVFYLVFESAVVFP